MRILTAFVCLVGLLLLPVAATQAGIYAADADADGTVTVSGTLTVSNPDGYTAAGLDLWSQPGYIVFDSDTLSGGSAGSSINYTYGDASAAVTVTTAPPAIDMDTSASVYDILSGEGYWSIGWAGGEVYLRSTEAQTVTVTIDYSYLLDTSLASPDGCHSWAKFHLALWDTADWSQKLPAGGDFLSVPSGSIQMLEKELDLTSIGTLSSGGTLEYSWDFSVPSGTKNYCLWSQVTASAATVPEPCTMGLLALGVLAAVRRRRR